jgi:predicted RNase H-like HicB family nuclease
MYRTFNVEIFRDGETGTYWATVPELYGCNSQGDTVDEALENIKEAITLCLKPLVVPGMIKKTVTLEMSNA